MIYALSILIGLFIFIFNMFKIPALILLIIIIIYTIIKEIKNKKYSRNIFKNIKETSEMDYTIMVINEIKGYKKIIINDNNIIAILEKGIFFIKVVDYKNKIFGNINDQYLSHDIGIKKYKIKNKIINYDNEFIKYQNKIKENINRYIVIRNDCSLDIKNLKNIKIINNQYLYYTIDKEKNKYDKNEINIIYNKLYM